MQIGFNFSTKKGSPSCLASTGNCSTTESLMRQFLSYESSVRAGMIDWDRFSIPITWFRSSNLLKRLSLTSELSSLSSAKKRGRMCSFVAGFSMMGHILKGVRLKFLQARNDLLNDVLGIEKSAEVRETANCSSSNL